MKQWQSSVVATEWMAYKDKKYLLFYPLLKKFAIPSSTSLVIMEMPQWDLYTPINGNPLQYSCLENSVDREA